MKKFCITFLMSGIIILSAIGFGTGIFDSASAAADTEYLRIHIRANSNSGEDQAVKYMVRDEVVKFLTPVVAEAETREAAIRLMNENLSGIERCADGVLRAHGFTYGAKAQVREEEFPTRVYGGIYAGSGRLSGSDPGIGYGRGGQLVVRRLSAALLCGPAGRKRRL